MLKKMKNKKSQPNSNKLESIGQKAEPPKVYEEPKIESLEQI